MAAPSDFEEFLGRDFTRRFDDPKNPKSLALTVAGLHYTRYQMTHDLDCAATPRAGRILTEALSGIDGVKRPADAVNLDVETLAAINGVGATTCYVFLCWRRHMLKTKAKHPMNAAEIRENEKAWQRVDVQFLTIKERIKREREVGGDTAKAKGNGKARKR